MRSKFFVLLLTLFLLKIAWGFFDNEHATRLKYLNKKIRDLQEKKEEYGKNVNDLKMELADIFHTSNKKKLRRMLNSRLYKANQKVERAKRQKDYQERRGSNIRAASNVIIELSDWEAKFARKADDIKIESIDFKEKVSRTPYYTSIEDFEAHIQDLREMRKNLMNNCQSFTRSARAFCETQRNRIISIAWSSKKDRKHFEQASRRIIDRYNQDYLNNLGKIEEYYKNFNIEGLYNKHRPKRDVAF